MHSTTRLVCPALPIPTGPYVVSFRASSNYGIPACRGVMVRHTFGTREAAIYFSERIPGDLVTGVITVEPI